MLHRFTKRFTIPLHFEIFFSFPFRKTLLKCFRGDELVGVVGIMTRLPFGLSGFQIPAGARGFFSYPKHPDHFWGPPSLLFNEYCDFTLGVKRSERETNQFPLSSFEIQEEWSHNFAPMAWRGIALLFKEREVLN